MSVRNKFKLQFSRERVNGFVFRKRFVVFLLFMVVLVSSCFVSVFSAVSPFVQGYDNYDISYVADASSVQYTVTVRDSYHDPSTGFGTGAGNYSVGTIVAIFAGERWDDGYAFSGWTVNEGGVTLSNNLQFASFTMPANNVVVTANWNLVLIADPPTNSSSTVVPSNPVRSEPVPSEPSPTPTVICGPEPVNPLLVVAVVVVVVGIVVGASLFYFRKGKK